MLLHMTMTRIITADALKPEYVKRLGGRFRALESELINHELQIQDRHSLLRALTRDFYTMTIEERLSEAFS